MTGVNFAALQSQQIDLIRKALGGSLFIAPSTAAVLTAITGADSLLVPLPTGYIDAGLMTDDGMRLAENITADETTSFGQVTPSRVDMTGDSYTLQADMQETNKITLALRTGAALSALVPDATSGELKITQPTIPANRHYRAFAIAVDGNPADGEIYIGCFLPWCRITARADFALSKANEIRPGGVTFTAEKDPVLGTPVVWYFGGLGWKNRTVAMGF